MNTSTVNISFQKNLLSEIDMVAKREHRTRSELLREAARAYIDQKQRWDGIFSYGESIANSRKLSEDDVSREIAQLRTEKKSRQ
ncbi:MAG TPA: CopG family transcriptional regulator [Lentisphaeria bacterium]|nr:MAG: CopG family transcriptional regulator [Lentisphaerae bacterium GWF2_50_93]HCE46074.1 CopG family transcriptional regulator [Lentisphaeria bacterium]